MQHLTFDMNQTSVKNRSLTAICEETVKDRNNLVIVDIYSFCKREYLMSAFEQEIQKFIKFAILL
jgi:hypothetical protein